MRRGLPVGFADGDRRLDLPFLRGAPYFIMEYLEGETLRVRIQSAAKQPEGRLGIEYLPMLQQIAKALAAVHQRGLVHRDLKPSSVSAERARAPYDPQLGGVTP